MQNIKLSSNDHVTLSHYNDTAVQVTSADESTIAERSAPRIGLLKLQTTVYTAVDYILASYNMRGLSKFYAPPGSAEKAASTLLKLEKHSPITILTGFCVTERLVDSKMIPVAETDGPPGAVLAGETLRKLSYRVSYVADPITCTVLRACLRSIKADDNCVYEFNSHHDENEQERKAKRK